MGDVSKYLLTGLATCECCGSGLVVTSRTHGKGRAYFYACAGYHQRGPSVCQNGRTLPMQDANEITIEALLDEVLDPTMIDDAVNEALTLLQGETKSDHVGALERELATVEQARERLVAAIESGG